MITDLQSTVPASVPLGQKSPYPKSYDKTLLEPVARARQRNAMKMPQDLKFFGFDVWNAYELFWMDHKGKPQRACATFVVPASSPNICESKSVKLYLNSLNHERFSSINEVEEVVINDISEICGAHVQLIMTPPHLAKFDEQIETEFRCLDHLDLAIERYQRDPSLLKLEEGGVVVAEKVVTHLFKSHCLCTGQPDMGSIFIEYTGPKICDESLLAYLISYRDHVGFSENCIEQIYADVFQIMKPERLTVFGRFTRRGGIDINPYRASHVIPFHNARLIYQ